MIHQYRVYIRGIHFKYHFIITGRFSEDVMRKMVLILSHLFARTFLHASYKRRLPFCSTSKVQVPSCWCGFGLQIIPINPRRGTP